MPNCGSIFPTSECGWRFSFQSKYVGMSPFECPGLFTILAFLEYEYGIYHPIGGCGMVTTALARIAEQTGIDIRVDEPVEKLLLEGRKQLLTHRELIGGEVAKPVDAKRAYEPACSGTVMYLGLDRRYEHLEHHNFVFSRIRPKSPMRSTTKGSWPRTQQHMYARRRKTERAVAVSEARRCTS